ncbi:hypothetical protein DL96DRAFT_1806371 [Flagelloscypha sp. PMI_526]|nr:hypothetical protein DL96DRAFT_1806371 [Flagelloscypha sp. PMI_526]
MAMPPPNSFLANFYQPLTLYANDHGGDKKQSVAISPPSKRSFFCSFLKRFRSGGWESKLQSNSIDTPEPKPKKVKASVTTVSLESLEWLENMSRRATSRSALWATDELLDIQTRSEQYKTHSEGLLGAKDVEMLHLRAAAAARTLLSLPEAPLPLLPHELMRCIFLWVACQDVAEAKNLSLLSTIVQNWVDPCVFKYLARIDGIEEVSSPRILRAKAHYLTGFNLVSTTDALEVVRLRKALLPVLRSLSYPKSEFVQITGMVPSISRLHIDDWTPRIIPLSSNVFSKITHLSLNLKTQAVRVFHGWDWEPLKDLVSLRCFIFQTHFFLQRGFCPNEIHAKLWIDFVVPILLPCIPPSVDLVIWAVPEINIPNSLDRYQILFDGAMDRRLVVAFERGDGLRTHTTSESAGAGPYAFVYPVLKQRRYIGLDWLEWLWEDALMFLRNRETAANDNTA